MRTAILLGIAVALAGCAKQSDREVEKMEMVEKGRDNAAICEQAKRVADAYLNERDNAGYDLWKARADSACMLAGYEPYNTDGIDMNAAMLGGDDLTAIGN